MLNRTFGCARVVWNRTLAARQARWQQARKNTSYAETDAALTLLKKDPGLAFLSEVSSVPLQQALRHQHQAFSAFYGKRGRAEPADTGVLPAPAAAAPPAARTAARMASRRAGAAAGSARRTPGPATPPRPAPRPARPPAPAAPGRHDVPACGHSPRAKYTPGRAGGARNRRPPGPASASTSPARPGVTHRAGTPACTAGQDPARGGRPPAAQDSMSTQPSSRPGHTMRSSPSWQELVSHSTRARRRQHNQAPARPALKFPASGHDPMPGTKARPLAPCRS